MKMNKHNLIDLNVNVNKFRSAIWIISLCLVCLGIGIYYFQVQVPIVLREQIIERARQRCPECKFELSGLKLNYLPGKLELNDFHFHSPAGEEVQVILSASKIQLQFEWKSLLDKKPLVTDLQLNNLVVLIIEDDRAPDSSTVSSKAHWAETLPELQIIRTRVRNTQFRYLLKNKRGQQGTIHLSQLQAEASHFASRPGLAPQDLFLHVSGRLEKSGKFLITSRVQVYADKNKDELTMRIDHQMLNDLDQFFLAEDNLKISGEVESLETKLHLEQGQLSGNLWAKYHELKIEFYPAPDRSKLKALAQTSLASFAAVKTRPKSPGEEVVAKVSYQRQPGDNLIKLLIKGLLPAAKKIISP